jgi:hypothetical protein
VSHFKSAIRSVSGLILRTIRKIRHRARSNFLKENAEGESITQSVLRTLASTSFRGILTRIFDEFRNLAAPSEGRNSPSHHWGMSRRMDRLCGDTTAEERKQKVLGAASKHARALRARFLLRPSVDRWFSASPHADFTPEGNAFQSVEFTLPIGSLADSPEEQMSSKLSLHSRFLNCTSRPLARTSAHDLRRTCTCDRHSGNTPLRFCSVDPTL